MPLSGCRGKINSNGRQERAAEVGKKIQRLIETVPKPRVQIIGGKEQGPCSVVSLTEQTGRKNKKKKIRESTQQNTNPKVPYFWAELVGFASVRASSFCFFRTELKN